MKIRLIALFLLLTGGCSTQLAERGTTLPAEGGWALLPMVNQSQSPRAGERVEALVETELRVRGVMPEHYPEKATRDPLALIDDHRRLEEALHWARARNLRYGVTGSVQEWRYKSGLDGEPAVGVSLRVIDLESGRVLWAASGARTGWGYESASGTAARLVRELLENLRLEPPQNP